MSDKRREVYFHLLHLTIKLRFICLTHAKHLVLMKMGWQFANYLKELEDKAVNRKMTDRHSTPF